MITLKNSALLFFVPVFLSCNSDEEIQKPIADFTQTSDNGYLAPTSISFKNGSIGASEYTWDFGDGTPVSNNINPIHAYEDAGTFTVTLIAANGDQFDQVTREIDVFNLPAADFTFSSNNDFKEQSDIVFENKSLYAETFTWKFGDGEISTEANPVHVYELPGAYTVELTAKNSKGTNVKTTEITIHPLTTEEQLQFTKLKGLWTLQSANDGHDRTADFPNLMLHLNGTYAEGEVYVYSFTGTRPNPSPWPASGDWMFGTSKASEIIRDPGGVSEILMTYSVTDTNLTISFNIPDGWPGWAGSRIKSVAGDWTFTFTK